ncbi:MAG: TetR/AcrR family transcriptional regulator [Paludibacter sp.]|jgi:AcrR family transcriptional regulator|nr:TetR/AcrR family transcriptional regulator [Paludibacter sp.]
MSSVRENIIAIASRLFFEYGIRSVSIDDICSKLQISKKTFYSIFSQKDELVETCLNTQYIESQCRVEEKLAGTNAIEGLITIMKEIRKNIAEQTPVIFYDLQKFYPQLYAQLEKDRVKLIQSGCLRNLQRGIAEGYYREDLQAELVSLFFANIPNTFLPMSETKKYSKKQLFDFFIDMLIRVIASPKGKEYFKMYYN